MCIKLVSIKELYFHFVRVAQETVAHCVRVVPANDCQQHTEIAVFTVIWVVWRLHIVTWCAQATVFSDTTLAVRVKNNSDRSGAGAVVMASNLT